jgi:hypothetical protein
MPSAALRATDLLKQQGTPYLTDLAPVIPRPELSPPGRAQQATLSGAIRPILLQGQRSCFASAHQRPRQKFEL